MIGVVYTQELTGEVVAGELVDAHYVDVVRCACGWRLELGEDRDGDREIVLQHLAAEHP